jgi:hypothetical protein
MKDFFKRIYNLLNFDGRDWAVLLLALLLAFSIWIIHNMALKYNNILQARIVAVSNIDGHAPRSINECQVNAKCRATGYKLLLHNLNSKKQRVEVNFPATALKYKSGDEYYILSTDLMEYSGQIFGSGISVEYFNADTLFYRFPFENHKKVPVVPVPILTYKGQYMAKGPLELTPDSVVVAGDPYLLESVKQVYTTPVRHLDISESISGVAGIEHIKGVNIQAKEVYYSMDVVRYVEFVSEAHVEASNLPADKSLMIFPSAVTLRMRCEFPLMDDAEGQQTVYVDYNDFKTSVGGNCPVRVKNLPKGILSYDVEPVSVRCVEESR